MTYDNADQWQWTVQVSFGGAWAIKEYHPDKESANQGLSYWRKSQMLHERSTGHKTIMYAFK